MRQEGHEFSLSTQGVGAIEFTDEVCLWVGESGIANGLLTLHVRHTSASQIGRAHV